MCSPADGSELQRRLDELEDKRRRYEALDLALENLPRHPQQRALVPVGPRLYAPGTIHRASEVLVLLGDGYFTERSAHDARGIVRRRLCAIEAAKSQSIATYAEQQTERICYVTEAAKHPAQRAVEDPTSESETSTSGSTSTTILLTTSNNSVTETNAETTTLPPSPPLNKLSKRRSILKSTDCSVDAASGKLVKSSSSRRVHFAIGTKKGESEDVTLSPGKREASSSSSTDPLAGTSKMSLQSEFEQAVLSAQQRTEDDGIIQFTEFYADDGGAEPTRVDMSDKFQPDNSVSFAEDSEEFLDITGAGAGAGASGKRDGGTEAASAPKVIQTVPKAAEERRNQKESISVGESVVEGDEEEDREMMIRDLLEAERAFAEQEEEEEEEDEAFGSGFARGFLSGGGEKKRRNAKVKAKEEKNVLKKPAVAAVQDAVSERKGGGKSARRRRRGAARRAPTLIVPAEVEAAETSGLGDGIDRLGIEDEDGAERPRGVSKFKEMRQQRC